MKMVPVSIEEYVNFRKGKRPRGKNFELLDAFMHGENDIVELTDLHHTNIRVARESIRSSSVRYGFDKYIELHVISDRLFMVKKKN